MRVTSGLQSGGHSIEMSNKRPKLLRSIKCKILFPKNEEENKQIADRIARGEVAWGGSPWIPDEKIAKSKPAPRPVKRAKRSLNK